MRFVDDDQIPFRGEDRIILIELPPDLFGATHILHGGKVDRVFSLGGMLLYRREAISLGARAVMPRSVPIEDLLEVIEPALIDHRAMRDNDGAKRLHLLSYMERTDGLPEAHLRIPELFIPLAELLDRAVNGLTLLRAKDERRMLHRYLATAEALSPLLNRSNSILDRLQIADIPLGSSSESFALDPRALQDAMYLLVIEATYAPALDVKCQLGVEELIADPRGLGVLIDTSTGSPIESIAIGLGLGRADIIG